MRKLPCFDHAGVIRWFMSPLGLSLALATILITACDPAANTTAPDRLAPGEASFAQAKVEICHRTSDDNYVKISIADAAYDIHIAHGDAPAGTGGLDAECQPNSCDGDKAVLCPMSLE